MESFLAEIADVVELALSAIALLMVVIGAVEALAGIARLVVGGAENDERKRAVWMRFARWLVAALTFQLAADIVSTTVAPTWDDIGRVAAIALVRTFLTYFLDRDIDAIRVREREAHPGGNDA